MTPRHKCLDTNFLGSEKLLADRNRFGNDGERAIDIRRRG
jgi:hypothetical protein